jgi:chlorobactene glucosyltransferase
VPLLIGFITLCLIGMAVIALLNWFTFPRLPGAAIPSPTSPRVSVLIPARDEVGVIGGTIKAWLAQTYPDYEVLLLDDGSTDGTAARAINAADDDPQFAVIQGQPLPTGWVGKNWACDQLSRAASGEILVFTDADVSWSSQALACLVGEMHRTRADLLSAWPTQLTSSWAERLVVPMLGFSVLGYLPVLAVHHIKWPIFRAAIGQCLAFQRDAYIKIGGHSGVNNELVEDMSLARKIKQNGMRLRLVDGAGQLSTRMYANWVQVRAGFAKNILAGHANSPFLLALSSLLHLVLFVFPWIWLFFDPLTGSILCGLGVLVRGLTASITRQRISDSIFLPVSVLLMTIIAGRALQWRLGGGARWKGRVYRNPG